MTLHPDLNPDFFLDVSICLPASSFAEVPWRRVDALLWRRLHSPTGQPALLCDSPSGALWVSQSLELCWKPFLAKLQAFNILLPPLASRSSIESSSSLCSKGHWVSACGSVSRTTACLPPTSASHLLGKMVARCPSQVPQTGQPKQKQFVYPQCSRHQWQS